MGKEPEWSSGMRCLTNKGQARQGFDTCRAVSLYGEQGEKVELKGIDVWGSELSGGILALFLVQKGVHVFFRCSNRRNAIVFHQEVQNIGGQKRRERRTKADVFNAEMQ